MCISEFSKKILLKLLNFKHDIVNIGDIPKQLSAVVQVAAEQVSTQGLIVT